MKTRNIFLLALTAILSVACHSWDDPTLEAGMESYGNQYIQETNVVTIDALKTEFKDAISKGTLSQITKPTQIKVIVTGNDEGSNIYKQLYVTDGTGSLYVYIDKSGLFSEAPVGQCMLIELNGLYISGYGKQPTICVPYYKEGSETASSGRMSRFIWQQHFKLISAYEGLKAGLNIKPAVISNMKSLDLEKDCGKLVTLVGVKMKDADGKNTFAPSDGSAKLVGGCVNREINGMSDVVVRTSTYAKFANKIMPTEKINITGIASRYNNTWQIMPRTLDDITMTTGKENVDDSSDDTTTPSGETDGTAAKPYTVADAVAAGSGTGVFVKAYIVGWIDGKTLSDGAKFNGTASVASNIIIADSPNETNISKCMPIQLPTGAVRSAVNLQDNPGNYKKEILLVGNIEKYFGATGVKSVSYAKIGDKEAGTNPGGGSSTGGGSTSGEVQAVTVAQFNAAAESADVWYQLTGTIKNLKDGDKYGNFDLEDETGSVYVYGLLSEKGGAKQKFQDLVTAKGIANGKKITIIGNRGSFQNKIEVMNAYFVSIE